MNVGHVQSQIYTVSVGQAATGRAHLRSQATSWVEASWEEKRAVQCSTQRELAVPIVPDEETVAVGEW
jgi:hypothetical protein